MPSGLLITGTSGAGKTTLATLLCKDQLGFQQVRAITTRTPRPDDTSGVYIYIAHSEFQELEANDRLLIRAEYRGQRYGISHEAVNTVIEAGGIPLVVATPKSVAAYLDSNRKRTDRFLAVFIDAPDETLDDRLIFRDGKLDTLNTARQRLSDRDFRDVCDLQLENIDIEESQRDLVSFWQRACF